MTFSRRILPGVMATAGIGAGLLAGAVVFVLFTTPGGRVAFRVVNGLDLPVEVGSFGGRLAGRFSLYGVALHEGPVDAVIDTVDVTWRPAALRARRVQFHTMDIRGLRLTVRESGDSAIASGSAPPDSIAVDASVRPWAFDVNQLRVRRAAVAAPGNVALRDVRIDASGGPDGYRARVSAQGSAWKITGARVFAAVSGTLDGVTVDTLDVVALDGHVAGDGFVRWTPGLTWRTRVVADEIHVSAIAPVPEDWLGALSARLAARGIHRDDSLRVSVDLESLEGTLRDRAVSAAGNVTVDGHRIEASRARLRWGQASVAFSGAMSDVADVTLDATIPSLAEIVPRATGSARIRGRITGVPEDMRVDVRVEGRDVRAGRFLLPDLDATLDATIHASPDYVPLGADVRRAAVRLGEGTLNARGSASWHEALEWDVALAIDRLETSSLVPARWRVSGPVSGSLESSGRHSSRRTEGRVAISHLEGTVRDRALRADGRAVLAERALDVEEFRVDWGATHLAADGHAGDTLDLAVKLTVPDLSVFDDSTRGSVRIDGTVRGPRARPAIDATIRADSVSARGYSVATVEGNVDLDPSFERPADTRLHATGIGVAGRTIDSLRVEVTGPRDDHAIAIRLGAGALGAALMVRGTLADSVWTGRIDSLSVRRPTGEAWRTDGRATARATRTRARVDSLALASNGARVALEGAWRRGGGARVGVSLDAFPLSGLERHLPSGARVTGTLDGSASVRIDAAQRVTARVDLVPGPGTVSLAGRSLDYTGSVEGSVDSTGSAARIDLSIARAGEVLARLDASAAIPGFMIGRDSLSTQPLEGRLDLTCADVGPVLTVFRPDLAKSGGSISASLTPVGTAGDFRLKGSVALENAHIDLPTGLRLRDVRVSANSDGQRLTVDGGVTSGGGRVRIKAESARSEGRWIAGTFAVQGERFQIINQPEAHVFISPEIKISVRETRADITGDVRVPYARIELAEVPSSAVTASNDVVFAEDTLSTQATLQAHTSVRVALGDSVTFSGFGLNARLEGSLSVVDERGKPTFATGEIQIAEGKYRAYGNELTIDPGRLIFGGGPIDNPGLDIRAYRGLKSQNVMTNTSEIVGVRLRGTLHKPEFSVFSNPPMSESETLSYLLFGRPLASSSESENAALANAAALVGMQQGSQIAGTLGKQFSLDEAYLETGETLKDASFVAGKYLSPKLYVSYATGFFEATNRFRVRYSLSDSWTVQAENGRASSTDLLYRFERGK